MASFSMAMPQGVGSLESSELTAVMAAILLRETMHIDVKFDPSVRARSSFERAATPSLARVRTVRARARAQSEHHQARSDGGRSALASGERHADLEVRTSALVPRFKLWPR